MRPISTRPVDAGVNAARYGQLHGTGHVLLDAIITGSDLKITLLGAAVPATAQVLIDQTAMSLPHAKIRDLRLEWTTGRFASHFAHLKPGDLAKEKELLLTTILADAINLGLAKMAEVRTWHTMPSWRGCELRTSALKLRRGARISKGDAAAGRPKFRNDPGKLAGLRPGACSSRRGTSKRRKVT